MWLSAHLSPLSERPRAIEQVKERDMTRGKKIAFVLALTVFSPITLIYIFIKVAMGDDVSKDFERWASDGKDERDGSHRP